MSSANSNQLYSDDTGSIQPTTTRSSSGGRRNTDDDDNAPTASLTGAHDKENDPHFLTPDEQRRSRSSKIVLLIGGLLCGMAIGLFSPLFIFYTNVADSPCTDATSAGACKWIGGKSSACQWNAPRRACVTDQMGQLCVLYGNGNATKCNNLTEVYSIGTGAKTKKISCAWVLRDSAGVCVDTAPAPKAAAWTSSEDGLIASMMIAGGFISSFAARRYVAGAAQVVRALQVVGGISIASSAFFMGGWVPSASFDARLGLVVVGRFASGLLLGAASVFCTLFNAINSPNKSVVTSNGVLFQISTALGIALAALLGLLVKRREGEMVDDGVLQRFQAVFGVNAGLSLLLCALPWIVTIKKHDGEDEDEIVVTPPRVHHQQSDGVAEGSFQNPIAETAAAAEPERVSSSAASSSQEHTELLSKQIDAQAAAAGGLEAWRAFFKEPKFAVACLVLAAGQVFCGINVVMSYGATITQNVGVSDKILGNFVIMIYNFVLSVVAVPVTRLALERGHDAKGMYILGALLAACSNLFTGLVSFPGVVPGTNARHALSMVGLALFCGFFQLTLGPHFYNTLATAFPHRVVKSATVFCLGCHWTLTAILLFAFPAMLEGFGGVPSGATATDEQKQRGFAACFLLFGGINLVAVVALRTLMPGLLREDEK